MAYRHVMLCAVVMTLAACNVSSVANEAPAASQDTPHQAKVAPMRDTTIVAPSTPTPGEAIRAIFDVAGDGSSAYEVENGSWAHFWYGYRFEVAGKHYYSAFVYQTPEKYGDDPAEDYPDPSVPATITQATFVLAGNDRAERWNLVGAQRHVGDFGAYEKGPTVNAGDRIETYRTPDGHQLLSIPAWVAAPGGIRQQTAEVFVLTPSDLRWTHAGSLATGEDNGAGCEAGENSRMPCTHSDGTLRFEPSTTGGIPDIAISLTGTAIDDKGHVRSLDAGTLARYRFNSRKSRYEAAH